MKSLKILSGIVIVALMPMLAEAQRGGQGQQGQSQNQDQDHRMHDGDSGQGMGMMNEERREHMQQMRALMQEIRQEEDPERRREMLQEHREQMRAGMSMMNRGQDGAGNADQSMEERMERVINTLRRAIGDLEEEDAPLRNIEKIKNNLDV
jgi:hypothetical protein